MAYAEQAARTEVEPPTLSTNTTETRIPQAAILAFERGGIGAVGKTFEEGEWITPQLDELMFSIFSRPRRKRESLRWEMLRAVLPHFLFNLQSERRAFEIAEGHYDLGNDLFEVMLDRSMTYTCGYWKEAQNLQEAQEAKLKLACDKLDLRPGMRVLDVGCGWGNFAEYAARRHGVSVVGLTVSKEQSAFAERRCQNLPVQILLQDYRQHRGSYDRIVSLEMIEAVGRKNMKQFYAWAANCLRPQGHFLVQAISADTISRTSPVSLDEFFVWIEKNIFPNGYLPTITELTTVNHSKLIVRHIEEFGSSYDRTLLAWSENFERGWSRLESKYSMQFKRRWSFYLNSCAALFRIGGVQLYQVLYSKGRE
ncbi:MAG: class I SAM-dependent methyltransferase [Deltaproteobacteria bacterium]|nr:class I SAM-dependent methyltransferase [Deltaproteobacteria bacterium]